MNGYNISAIYSDVASGISFWKRKGFFEEITSMLHCQSMKMYSKRRNHSLEVGYEG